MSFSKDGLAKVTMEMSLKVSTGFCESYVVDSVDEVDNLFPRYVGE